MNTAELRKHIVKIRNKDYDYQLECIEQGKAYSKQLNWELFDAELQQSLAEIVNRITSYSPDEYVDVPDEEVERMTNIINKLIELDGVVANFTKQQTARQ